MADTFNCVFCFNQATRWTGHVLKDGKKITAGWCDIHNSTHLTDRAKFIMNFPVGYCGEWIMEMGIRGKSHPYTNLTPDAGKNEKMKTREIKFRAWSGTELLTMPISGNYGLGRFFSFLPETAVLMQYTGLKDKNGKEVYEGDIIVMKEYKRRYKIVFEEAAFKIIHAQNDSLNGVPWGTIARMFELPEIPTIEIIGNIYENPNLLTP